MRTNSLSIYRAFHNTWNPFYEWDTEKGKKEKGSYNYVSYFISFQSYSHLRVAIIRDASSQSSQKMLEMANHGFYVELAVARKNFAIFQKFQRYVE